MIKLLATALLSLVATTAPVAEDGIDFERHANGFALDHNLVGVDEWDIDFRAILEKGYAHVSLGLFEVYYPIPDLQDSKKAATFRGLCLHVLDMQQLWLDMLKPETGKLKQVESDLKLMRKWVAGWSISKLGKLDPKGEHDLLLAFKDTKRYGEASDRLQASFLRGESLGMAREEAQPAPLVLCPTRKEFVRLVCYAGLVFEEERDNYWADDLHTWIEGRIMDLRVIALEYADTERAASDIYGGSPMNVRREDELEQHVIQRAFLSLLQNYYGDRMDPALAVGLAINVDIDLFGKDHARLEGDPRGNSTPPREVFVPGGNPDGGFLPPLNADSHWREFEGEERYLTKLSQSQNHGNRSDQDTQEKLESFQLIDDAESNQRVIRAPFLGSPAASAPMPPADFIGDYMEFFRAYRTGFAQFLRVEAGSSAKDSAKRFATLMTTLANDEASRTLEEIVPEVYDGKTLSSEELGKSDLEGRFLRWLKDRK
ncbi:MAG: hypothetical protein P1V81_13640 [Planctomycetota bacterium]|nr:hypothetical protein [Planctomycetota bacterium]